MHLPFLRPGHGVDDSTNSGGEPGRWWRIATWLIGAGMLAWSITAAPATGPSRTLIVGSEQNYPPFAVGMTDQTADGFTVELWKTVAAEQGLSYEIRVQPFGALLQDFKSGAVDVLINLAKSDERRTYADFSVTHVAVGGAIFVRDGDDRIRSEPDLTGKSLIVMKADLAHDYAQAKGWQPQLVLVDNAEQGLHLLASGKHDAMLLGKLVGLQTIRDQHIAGVKALQAGLGFSQHFAFAVHKGDADLLARINEGLALAKTNGVYDRLYEKWFGVYETKQPTLRSLAPALAGALALGAAAWGVMYVRRRQRDRLAEARLRVSEERWNLALEGAGDGVWDADLVAGVTLYSRRWKQMLGYEEHEIGTDPSEWNKRIHPDDIVRVMQDNEACLKGNSDRFASEFRMQTKNGGWIWVLDRGKVVRRGSDGKAQRMIGTHTAISERKLIEEALRGSEERLQRALDASRLALWDLDLATGDIFLSDAWSEMLGGPRQPTRTSFDALSRLVPDDDQARIAQAMGDTLRGLTPSYAVEHRVRRPDGQTLWVLSQGRVVERDGDGRVRRAVGTNRDITERQLAQATQLRLESRLREAQKLEAIGTLAGGIAHDFNNIMAAILGNVALARQDIESNHPAQAQLVQIGKAGQRARTLVQQILAFSRNQPGELVSRSLRPIVEESVAMLRSTVGPKVLLRTVLPDHPLRVLGNTTQLQQVLLNLGSNASHALPDEGGAIDIGLEEVALAPGGSRGLPASLPAGSYAHLWVSDNGSGIAEEALQRIFEPFFTTKQIGQGTGLGLAVVHGVMESHGGAVTVTTALGKGSTFHLYLPLVDDESAPAPLQASDAELPSGHGQRVLYVDDDEVMLLMVQSLLQRLGYQPTCLMDAREALSLVERDPAAFDLVVTDFNMPDLSGVDVAARLAELRPDLPVVISSGFISEDLRAAAHRLRVRAVMQKEHTIEELGAVIHSILHATD
jgi:PAS domain S-box-containing protein